MLRNPLLRLFQSSRQCYRRGIERETSLLKACNSIQWTRLLAQVHNDNLPGSSIAFSGSLRSQDIADQHQEPGGGGPRDERRLRLGNTVRTIHERLPTLLASPLPADILSPNISLHLFPSTHPYLPTVKGKIPYAAALWTAPVAWGRVPVVGNIRLIILSERMVKNGVASFPAEKLIVRWRTCGKTKGRGMGAFYRGISGNGDQVDKITEYLGGDVRDDEEFTGLFIFEFDDEGRIETHTIEHAEEGRNWEKKTKVISVTDWLIGKAKGADEERDPGYALGYCDADNRTERHIHSSR